jgi:curved DNA-binding protein CbpA
VKNYYDILGVDESADELQIKNAYRKLAKRYHPDVNAGAKGAEDKFKEIAEAYDVLSDPVLKSNYDRKRTKQFYHSFDFSIPGTDEKKDPRRKEYTEAELAYARARHNKRTEAHMRRRKRILAGMIITFVIFMVAAVQFESYIEKKREEQAQTMALAMQKQTAGPIVKDSIKPIADLDSPYDSLFGKGIYVQMSPNEILVYNPISDAVVCLIQAGPPYRTIRNEFITSKHAFRFAELPNGSFRVKVETGSNWDPNKMVSNGWRLGGFTQQTNFYLDNARIFSLQKPTYEHPNTNTSDTITIDPVKLNFTPISASEFFHPGQ